MNVRRLDVATAFHSEIVSSAAVPFAEFLARIPFGTPTVPVYANATAQPYAGGAREMQTTLANQIAQPVQFAEQIQAMWQAGARTFIEVGPGSVLTNLVGKCLAGQQHSAVSLDAKGRNGIRSLWIGLAQLVAAGVPMNFEGLWSDYRVVEDPRTREKPKLTLKINGSNYGRPQINDEPVQRPIEKPTEINTYVDHSVQSNGHRTAPESKLTPAESIASVARVDGTASPVDPSAPVPVVRAATAVPPPSGSAPAAFKGNGAHPPASAAAVIAPPSAAATVAAPPVGAPSSAAFNISADVVTEMVAALGTLQDAIGQLQGHLQGLMSGAATASPPAAPPAIHNGTSAMPAPPVVPDAFDGAVVMPVPPAGPGRR